jgi:glycosyltransferase involved in cell wall biosynthesis
MESEAPSRPSVRFDAEGGAAAAFEHLVELGHRRIAVIGGPEAFLCSRARIDGYRAVLDRAGIPADPALVRHGNFHHDGGDECARELLALPDPPTAVFAGRLAPEKGADVLVQALPDVLRAVPDARVEIAGQGPQRKELTRLVADLGVNDRVALLGHLPRSEVERRFNSAWVQAVPSRWEEPFGNVVTEAMMRGTAVVASRLGGPAEIVRDGETGLLVPPGDAGALANALVRLLSCRDDAERLGAAGRRVALEHYSESRVIARFEGIYRRLIDASRHPPEP